MATWIVIVAHTVSKMRQNGGLALQFESDALKGDAEVVTAAVRQNGLALQFASDALKGDAEVVTAAVNNNGLALQFASDALKGNDDVVYIAMRQNDTAFGFALESWQMEHVLTKLADGSSPRLCELSQWIPTEERTLRKMIHYICYINQICKHLSYNLKDDKNFMIAVNAIIANYHVKLMHHVSTHGSIAYDARINGCGYHLYKPISMPLECIAHMASDRLLDDKAFMLAIVTQNGFELVGASDQLKDDKELVMKAVKQSARALNHAHDRFKDDKDVMMEVVKQAGGYLYSASDRLKDDKEVVLAAAKQDIRALQFAPDHLLREDKDVVMLGLSGKSEHVVYKSLSPLLKNDSDVIALAVSNLGSEAVFEVLAASPPHPPSTTDASE